MRSKCIQNAFKDLMEPYGALKALMEPHGALKGLRKNGKNKKTHSKKCLKDAPKMLLKVHTKWL